MYDIKYLMKFCDNLHGGLNKLAEVLQVERIGPQHQVLLLALCLVLGGTQQCHMLAGLCVSTGYIRFFGYLPSCTAQCCMCKSVVAVIVDACLALHGFVDV